MRRFTVIPPTRRDLKICFYAVCGAFAALAMVVVFFVTSAKADYDDRSLNRQTLCSVYGYGCPRGHPNAVPRHLPRIDSGPVRPPSYRDRRRGYNDMFGRQNFQQPDYRYPPRAKRHPPRRDHGRPVIRRGPPMHGGMSGVYGRGQGGGYRHGGQRRQGPGHWVPGRPLYKNCRDPYSGKILFRVGPYESCN